MPRLLQEALRFGRARQEDHTRSEGEGREVASRRGNESRWAGALVDEATGFQDLRPRDVKAPEGKSLTEAAG